MKWEYMEIICPYEDEIKTRVREIMNGWETHEVNKWNEENAQIIFKRKIQ